MLAKSLSDQLAVIQRLMESASPPVAIVVGTGVSIAASGQPQSSWLGLLEHGVRHLVNMSGKITPKYGENLIANLQAAFWSHPLQLDVVLTRAHEIETFLTSLEANGFSDWLRLAFADLRCSSASTAVDLMRSLDDLRQAGALLVTTNYDSLLTEATGLPPVTWQEPKRFNAVLNGLQEGVLHVHGHWNNPESIVLSRTSYDRVTNDADYQHEFRRLWQEWHWVYVGCGNGLDDPNMGSLLEWGKRWGDSSRPDYFLARDDEAAVLNSRPDKPGNLTCIGYPKFSDLPEVLGFLSPVTRSAPFVRVDDDFGQFRQPGADIPFPSRQEYAERRVPELQVDAELENRLARYGWACVYDVASVGKTTLAMRVASTKEQLRKPVYYLDCKHIPPDNDGEAEEAEAALRRLARPGTLLIVDNVHHQPVLARRLWDAWRLRPADHRGRLLILGTQIQQSILRTPDEDLYFFLRHVENPALQVQPTPEDLGRIANYLYTRKCGPGARAFPTPPTTALKDWHRDYRAALNAFMFAVWGSLAEFARGDWDLPLDRGAQWVRKHWLDRLSLAELDNILCLAAFGGEELEIDIPLNALPHPLAMQAALENASKSQSLSQQLVLQNDAGKFGQYARYALREPGWGRLMLAASGQTNEAEQLRFNAAARDPILAVMFTSRLLRERETEQYQRLWAALAEQPHTLIATLPLVSLITSWRLLRYCRRSKQRELEAKLWESLPRSPDQFAAAAWAASLEKLGSFLSVAKSQGVDTANWWAILKDRPAQFAAAAWAASLDGVGSFLSVAKSQGVDTANWWAILKDRPAQFAAAAWAASLDGVGSFLSVAKSQGVDTANWWAILKDQPAQFAAAAWAASLDKLGSFLSVAKSQGVDTSGWWAILEDQPDQFAATAWATSLDHVGSFLSVAKSQGVDTSGWWAILDDQPDQFAATAWALSLHGVGSFLSVAKSQGVDTSGWWAILEDQPDQFAAAAWASSLHDVGSFLSVAKSQGVDTSGWWAILEDQPDQFAATAWASSLHDVGSFLSVAKSQGVDTSKWWAILKDQPDQFAAAAWATSLDHVGSFLSVAKSQGVDTANWWAILAQDPDRLAERGKATALNNLGGFGHYAPPEVMASTVRDIAVGHWDQFSANETMLGGTWIAWACGNAGRADLRDDLCRCLLRRANKLDFPILGGGFGHICWLVSNAPENSRDLVMPFLDDVVTASWLKSAYTSLTCGKLAAGLRELGLAQAVDCIRRFHHPALGQRLQAELARFRDVTLLDRSAIVQLLGCAGLCGWAVSRKAVENIPMQFLFGLLRDAYPHRSTGGNIEPIQYQFWLGLRSLASILKESLPVARHDLEETFQRWRVNMAESSMATSNTTRKHVDVDMVAWLERCLQAHPVALLPAKPLWRLTGFPLDPR